MSIISEGLKENHTIYGMHVIGNEAQVNSQGFIDVNPETQAFENKLFSNIDVLFRINTNLEKGFGINRSVKSNQLKSSDNCWICEGFVDFEVELIPDISSLLLTTEIIKNDPEH